MPAEVEHIVPLPISKMKSLPLTKRSDSVLSDEGMGDMLPLFEDPYVSCDSLPAQFSPPTLPRHLQRTLSEATSVGTKRHRGFRPHVVERWWSVVRRVMSQEDPWGKFRIEDCPTETAKRYRYSALRKVWKEDFVEIKVQPEPFARGAMRECYRCKKLSTFVISDDWDKAGNYVAKSYLNVETERDTIFEDVRLQMDAKLWADEYNRHHPPKKVDMLQMGVLEFVNRPGKPLFHIEHYIQGEYIKYNSNSGFISEDARQTPQAFSHFTFERSGHQCIIVDVQGVGDLYTDPQIHTADGKGYGDGNLGTKGMALFFQSHMCNDICNGMDLTCFDLSVSERAMMKKGIMKRRTTSETVCKQQESMCVSPIHHSTCADVVMEYIRYRSASQSDSFMDHASDSGVDVQNNLKDVQEEEQGLIHDPGSRKDSTGSNPGDDIELVLPLTPGRRMKVDSRASDGSEHELPLLPLPEDKERKLTHGSIDLEIDLPQPGAARVRKTAFGARMSGSHDSGLHSSDVPFDDDKSATVPKQSLPAMPAGNLLAQASRDLARRCRVSSDVDSDVGSMASISTTGTHDSEREAFWADARKKSKPSGMIHAEDLRRLESVAEDAMTQSVLGQVHLDMARYHELGRFLPEGSDKEQYDKSAAWYHLEVAANCGVVEAINTCAKIYLNIKRDLLQDFEVEEDEDNVDRGLDWMEMAARHGDRGAMIYLAESYDLGGNLGSERFQSHGRCVYWYEKALEATVESEEGAEYDATLDTPNYQILQRLAELFRTGGVQLMKDANRAGELYNEGAEAAMEAMKGKLANKFYMLAEECYGEVEEEEEEDE